MDDVENMGFYRYAEFEDQTGMSDSCWVDGSKAGRFPPGFKLGVKAIGYLKQDIHIYMKYKELYKRPRKEQLWVDIKKMMLEHHPD